MSEFKFRSMLWSGIIVAFICFILSFYFYLEAKKMKQESYSSISLYTAEGDTILDIDTNSDWVKVWIGDSCGVDVWTINEEGGWTRK